MKKLIISGSGTGKSKKCFEAATAYNGTVVYLNGVPKAENMYIRRGHMKPDDFIIMHFGEDFSLENNKKYFISPENGSDKVVFDYDNMETNYFKNITTDLLLIIDDNFWANYCDDKVASLKALTSSKRDVILTAQNLGDLIGKSRISKELTELIELWES